jgi:outer membrane protein
MKLLSTILSVLAFVGVVVLFIFHFNEKKTPSNNSATALNAIASKGSIKVAYVDVDSFENNYLYLKSKREEFSKRQQSMQAELDHSAQQLQTDYAAFQEKVQKGTIGQSEGEAAEKRLMQMQQTLRLREQSLTEQLVKEKDDFNEQLHKDLEAFIEEYNKDKGFDYILSYSKVTSSILYGNEALNITKDIIDGMNARKKPVEEKKKK